MQSNTINFNEFAVDDAGKPADETAYDYITPKHYQLFTVEDLRQLVAEGRGLDVCALAEKTGLVGNAYEFLMLKYMLRQNKPNEPRRRDVEKIKKYSELWLDWDNGNPRR